MQPFRLQYPNDLPISARRDEIIAAISQHQVVIIAGETGSGKTTQLPKMCLEAGLAEKGKIGCTQPRRVAAMSISKRVAEELAVTWGREVGCKMRFSDDTSKETQLKFMTDGILLTEIQSDPLLRQYQALILDEAHERSLNIDFLLGYLKGLLPKRPDLKLIITSATIDTQAFSEAYDQAPIIEVSGRLYPVEIRYRPLESFGAIEEELGYVEAAAEAAEEALMETSQGDVLVFMPTERDIRECADMLSGRLGSSTEVLGLFGRMPTAEQQRIFSPGAKRRVVIATNVAETSLTIPRIRFVIDTGLARISRYTPRTRTKRLPVEAIAQSSCNQRTGRAGRLSDGICVRLFSEEDFLKRTAFAQPEIQRANLAEVILRMKAFKLGDIENFPFINAPSPAAIRSGYDLLLELGAMDEEQSLTRRGRDLANLPMDPTLGRMLLHAREEKVLHELLVIASGLSIPDPRERPEEAREKATMAHRAFASPTSDFLSLLKIWEAAPDATSAASRNALRKFCKNNFLSLTRMREWRDIYRQLLEVFQKQRPQPIQAWEGRDDAIHRCILSGLLGHVAMKQERNIYKASSNRQVVIFPGSHLFERRDKKPAPKSNDTTEAKKPAQPAWIVAGEIVQTSQLFARTVARIDPAWILQVGEHLCRRQYSEPHWSVKTGRVLCWQKITLYGLEIKRDTIDYGKIDPQGATEMFIRHALLEKEENLYPYPFIEQNFRLADKLATLLIRSKQARFLDMEEQLFEFYRSKLQNVSSLHDLNRKLKQEHLSLQASEKDLLGDVEVSDSLHQFPDSVQLGSNEVSLRYAYQPGEETDGITIQLPLELAEHVTESQLQWLVPGMREEIIGTLIRALPRRLRRDLQPLDPKISCTVAEFSPSGQNFLSSLASFLTQRFKIQIQAADWPADSLPPYLRPRVEVLTQKRKSLAISRDLKDIRAVVKEQAKPVISQAWDQAAKQWEKPAIHEWSFGDLPKEVTIEQLGSVTLKGYPGLFLDKHGVHVKLFKTEAEVAQTSPPAIRYLGRKALSKDLVWIEKELKHLAATPKKTKPQSFMDALQDAGNKLKLDPKAAQNPLSSDAELQHDACENLIQHFCQLQPLHPLSLARYQKMLETARKELPMAAQRLKVFVKQVIELYEKIQNSTVSYPGMREDLNRLAPNHFLQKTPFHALQHLPRYLKAILIRAERAHVNPAKDDEKAYLIEDFDHWEDHVPAAHFETFRWMFEEYRVQIFAQELGTAQPVSAKRLEKLMEV